MRDPWHPETDEEEAAMMERLDPEERLRFRHLIIVLAAEHMTFPDYVDLESERHLRIAASEDTAEAFRAFMEKRPPKFPSTSARR